MRVTISGNSMSPAVKSGETIDFSTQRKPVVGDIVLFRQHGELIAHRYVGKGFVKGDNSKYMDGKVGEDFEILGVAPKTYCRPILAWLSSFNLMSTPVSRFSRALILILS